MLAVLLGLLACAMASHNLTDAGAGCNNKKDNTIECCAGFDEELWIFEFTQTACADVVIDWESLDVTLVLSLDNTVLFYSTFGLDNPPELCTTWKGLDVCIELTDLDLDNWRFTGCLTVKVNDKEIDLGCWDTSRIINQ